MFRVTYLEYDSVISALIQEFIKQWYSESDTLECQTSGSTGTPKLIHLQKSHMRHSARTTGDFFDFSPTKNLLLCLHPSTIGGKMQIVRAMEFEMELVVIPPTRNPFEKIEKPLHFCSIVPLQLKQILSKSPQKINLFKYILLGGAPIDQSLLPQIQTYTTEFFEGFGMTETISHIALKNLTKNESSFTTLSSYTISENDGKLVVNAPEIGVHQLLTNDLIRTQSSNTFEWIGRADFTINTGGYKFQPEQLEVILAPYISSHFFFTKEPDPTYGEIIVMIVEKSQSSQDEKSIRKICKRELPIYAQPKNIRFIAHIISTPSGKINRVETLKSINS